MNRTDVIYLVTTTYTKDAYGVNRPTKTQTKYYVDVSSVSQTEFFQGGAAGLKPEWRFTMNADDFLKAKAQGVEECIYNNEAYSIYRTFLDSNNNAELYVEKKQGVNNG